ncbi:TIGR00289 family protein [archaeon]|jgi:diphthine-ammonia ligase|nr:TIGR00289 family protein [archaeon]MBT4397300.1 TIGR00289 family protein [archaeon]MBT4440680.1 TIGR00289 family protein [archaeon]
MKLGVLFTGGKDSCYALYKAREKHDVVCLISIISENKESFMFHTPNIEITDLQAKAIGLPLLKQVTKGEKEKELKDLEIAIENAVKKYKIEGIVTGAVESVYQATRVQKICNKLGLGCFNPLWKRNQEELLKEIVDEKFKVIISGVFAYPLDFQWLGKVIDKDMIERLIDLSHGKYEISPTGEGGEYESTVLDAPFFKKEIEIIDFEIVDMIDSGVYNIKGGLK